MAHYVDHNTFHSECRKGPSLALFYLAYILLRSAKSLLTIISVITCMLMKHRFTYHFHNQMHKNMRRQMSVLLISCFVCSNKLIQNTTDLIIFGINQHRNRVINHVPVKLLGSDTFPSNTVRNLGVAFDSDFNFRQHILQVCKSYFYHIRDLRRIRRHTHTHTHTHARTHARTHAHTHKYTAQTLSTALISSRLDYCNSLLNNIVKRDKQRINSNSNEYKIVWHMRLRAPLRSPPQPLLRHLHWLPVYYRNNFKQSTLTYRAL